MVLLFVRDWSRQVIGTEALGWFGLNGTAVYCWLACCLFVLSAILQKKQVRKLQDLRLGMPYPTHLGSALDDAPASLRWGIE